jgi:hypothetical protein
MLSIHVIGTPFGITARASSTIRVPRGRSSANRSSSRSRIARIRSTGIWLT